MSHPVFVILFTVLLLPGALLVLIPLFPAFWYLITMATIFGVIDGFQHLSVENFVALLCIFLLSVAVDWSAGLLGAKFGGAAWKSLLWGGLGAVVGLFIFPPFGAFVGLFLGVLGAELNRRKDGYGAFRATSGALVGTLTGIIVNALLAMLFVTLFVFYALF